MRRIFKVVLFILIILVMFSCTKQEEIPNEPYVSITNVNIHWRDPETMELSFTARNLSQGYVDVRFEVIYTATTRGRSARSETAYFRLSENESKTFIVMTRVGWDFIGNYKVTVKDIKEINDERQGRETDLDNFFIGVYWVDRFRNIDGGVLKWDY